MPSVRRPLAATLALTATAGLAGCGGGGERKNLDRPAPPVTLTAAIHDNVVQVSPASIGAGTIVLVVSNQSKTRQTVTFETDELGGRTGGRTASSPAIEPSGTGRLTIDAREGRYSVHVADRTIRAARVNVGPPRPSGQNRVLLP